MSRPAVVSIVTLILAACTSGRATPTTTDTPPTTSPAVITTTTPQVQVVDGGLMPFDPGTLVPVPGAKALVVADDHWGVVSPSGRWAAIQSWTSGATESYEMTVVDLDSHVAAPSIRLAPGGSYGLTIRDDGTAFWLTGGDTITVKSMSRDGTTGLIPVEFPEGFFADDLAILDGERVGLFGAVQVDNNTTETMVIIVDAQSGETMEYPLPTVTRGAVAELEEIDGLPVFEFAYPAATFDINNNQVIVAEATRDAITTLDLATGQIEEHLWRRPTAFLDGLLAWLVPPAQAKGPSAGTTRSVYLTPDGSKLFVGTSVGRIEAEEEIRTPDEIAIIDTTTWEASTIPVEADIFTPSPDGRFLTAQGLSYGVDENFTPVYVIDTATEDVFTEIPLDNNAPADTSFSPDTSFAYIQTYDAAGTKIEILDLGLGQLVGAVEFREIDLIGEAGLMAFQIDS